MCDQSATFTRELLLTKSTLSFVVEFPKIAPTPEGQVFESVLQGTCIYLFRKRPPENDHSFVISSNNDVTTIESLPIEPVQQQALMNFYPESYCIPLVAPNDFQLMKKINTHSVRLNSIIDSICQGDMNLTSGKHAISSKVTPVKLLRGRNVMRYCINYDVAEWVLPNFRNERVRENVLETFLVCQEVTGTVDARRLHFAETIPGKYLFGHTANKVAIPDRMKRRTILGILNSRLMDWYFRKTSTNNHVGGYEIVQLPIRFSNTTHQEAISTGVEKVLAAKKADPTADTSALEAEIDELVFDLYGLTEEEKAIVRRSGAQRSEVGSQRAEDGEEKTEDGLSAVGSANAKGRKTPEPSAPKKRGRKPQLPPSLPGWD